MVNRLKDILTNNTELRSRLERVIALHAKENPDRRTNPVQSLDDLYVYAERFLHKLPCQGLDLGEESGLFRRIDQSIGYFYYIFGDLQTDEVIARWLGGYDTEWGRFLSSPESWNPEVLRLAQADPLFELDSGRYEPAGNWRSWNDFFSRRLAAAPHAGSEAFVSPCDGYITDSAVKTASIENWLDLLGDSPYRGCFEKGMTFHIVLDMYDYHRFHAPVGGVVLDLRLINGVHHAGGTIVWDGEEQRYRYESLGDRSFQMMEKRGVLVLETDIWGKVAMVPVGVAQVSSVNWCKNLTVGRRVRQCDELGCFLCGGSDMVLFFERWNDMDIVAGMHCRACEPLR